MHDNTMIRAKTGRQEDRMKRYKSSAIFDPLVEGGGDIPEKRGTGASTGGRLLGVFDYAALILWVVVAALTSRTYFSGHETLWMAAFFLGAPVFFLLVSILLRTQLILG